MHLHNVPELSAVQVLLGDRPEEVHAPLQDTTTFAKATWLESLLQLLRWLCIRRTSVKTHIRNESCARTLLMPRISFAGSRPMGSSILFTAKKMELPAGKHYFRPFLCAFPSLYKHSQHNCRCQQAT